MSTVLVEAVDGQGLHIRVPDINVKVDAFLQELRESENDKRWEECTRNSKLTVWRRMDKDAGLYRLKMVGLLPCSMEVANAVLLDPTLRRAWDKIIMDMTETPLHVTNGGDYKTTVVYTSVRAPLTLTNRDFVVERATRELADKSSRIVFDVSIEHPAHPARKDFIRADTKFSGLLFEPATAPDWDTKLPVAGVAYRTLTLVDTCGDIPKKLVNLLAAKSTADWFDDFSKACKKHIRGTLLKGGHERSMSADSIGDHKK